MLLMALPGNFNDTGPGTVPRINWVTDAPGIGPALGVVSFVPEPISLALFGTGLAALCIVRRSRGREKKGAPPAP